MPGRDVDLLNKRRVIRWRMQAQIAARRHLSATPPGEADGNDVFAELPQFPAIYWAIAPM